MRLDWIRKDHLGGALTVLIGALAVGIGHSYDFGSLNSMGAGFFPVTLGVIMMLCGAIIFAVASITAAPHSAAKARMPEWRGWACIVAGLFAFILLGHYGGLVPATVGVVVISALGDRRNNLVQSLLLAAAIVVCCIVVFHWALHVEFPLFAWDA